MVRPTDWGMPAIKKIVCYSAYKGVHHTAQGHTKHQDQIGGRGNGKMWARVFTVVFAGRMGEAG